MSPPAIATVKPLPVKGVRMVWPRLLAYRLDRLAVVEGRDLLMSFSIEDDRPRVSDLKALGYRPRSVALSASRRYLLVGNDADNFYEVRDAQNLALLSTVSAPERFSCAFASLSEMDVLISAPRPGVIEVLSLPDGDPLARIRREGPKPFVVSHVTAVGDGQRIAFVGHPYLSLYSTYLFADTTALDGDAAGSGLKGQIEQAMTRRGSLDLAVGPCGWDDVLVYEGNPTPRGAGQDGAGGVGSGASGGFTVRRLETGDVVEHVACARVLGPRTPVMGTSLAVALAFGGGVEILPRKDLAEASPLAMPARAVSFDPDAGRLALATPECTIALVELARV